MRRGGGGLVSGLAAVTGAPRDPGPPRPTQPAGTSVPSDHGPDVLWVCASLNEADRTAARRSPDGRIDQAGYDTGGAAVRMLDIPAATFDRAYNAVANSTLWFVHHLLYDTPRSPHFDARARRDWQSYEAYNAAFADALARDAAHGAKAAIQDYHLSLAPRMLRERRPDLKIVHFSHTPWAPPEYYKLLPDDIGVQVLLGILGADHAGFLTERWASAFLDCCELVPGARVDRTARTVTCAGHTTHVGVHGLGVDEPALRKRAAQQDVVERARALRSRWATVSSSCGSTVRNCRRTSCAVSPPTGRCSSTIPSGADAWCTWRSPTRPATTCPSTAHTRQPSRTWPSRSRTSSAPLTGSR